jgi:hypothetical protein
MKLVLILVMLAGLAACVDSDQEWARKCTANGFAKELCVCIAEKVPSKQRETLAFFAEPSFGGGWVLVPNEDPAATCAKYVGQVGAASKS